MNNISKKFSLDILTEVTTPVNTRVSLFTLDSVEFTVNVLEEINPLTKEKLPKDLTGCSIRAYVTRQSSKTTVVQEFGLDEFEGEIEILDPVNGVIKYKPNIPAMECADKMSVQFKITDSDESISTQSWLFSISDTIEGEIVIPTDKIRSLEDLDKAIKNNEEVLVATQREIEDTREKCDSMVEEATTSIKEVEGMTLKLEDRVHNLENGLSNNKFITQSKLTPFVDSNGTVSFKMSISNYSVKQLIKTFLDYFIFVDYGDGAVVSIGEGYSYILTDSVYLGNNKKVDVSPRSINPSLRFNNGTNKISVNSTSYEIQIKTSIDQKYISGCGCYIKINGQSITWN